MTRINLTQKGQSEQIRILNDYLNRRSQHKNQGVITIDQLVNRFRHNRCFTKRAKATWLSKLMRDLKSMDKNNFAVEKPIKTE